MLNIKIYKLLELANTVTRNRFDKYVRSPYFNANQDLILLLEVYLAEMKSKKERNLTKKEIWDTVYAKVSFNDAKFRQLNTKLLGLYEDYIAQEKYNNNPFVKSIFQLEQVKKPKYQPLENQIVKSSKVIGDRYEELSSAYHLNMFKIENAYYNLTQDWEKKSKRKSKFDKFNFNDILNHLDTFYLAEKLKFVYTQLFWESYSAEEKSDLLNDEILEIVNKGKFRSNPLLLCHYYSIRTITNPDKENYYRNLKELVFSNYAKFGPFNKRFFFECLLTYTIRKVNAGQKEFESETFELYKIGLDRELFLKDNLLSIISFRNIIGIALKQKEFNWTEKFILEYSNFLPLDERENAVNFNLARVYFRKRDFSSALLSINQVDLEDIHYTLLGRTMQIAIYYELNEFDALLSSIDSFRVYLNRTKILKKERIDNFKNYLKFTKSLASLESSNKAKLKKVFEDISKTKMVNKGWILDKVKELGYEPVSA